MRGLKPCPFCGEEAIYKTLSKFTSNNGKDFVVGYTFSVGCKECYTSLPETYSVDFSMNTKGEIIHNTDDREKAQEQWNRRANNERTKTD